MQLKATTGAAQNTQDAVSGSTICLKELPQIPVGLEYPRALAALHPFLELQDDALDERRKGQHREHLADLEQDIGPAHGAPVPLRHGDTPQWRVVLGRRQPARSSKRLLPAVSSRTGVISPAGAYKANSITLIGKP